MVDKIVPISEKRLEIISDAIHFEHPDLQSLGIEMSENIKNPVGDIVAAIDNKFFGDDNHFQLTDTEAKFAYDALLEYRDYLNSIKSTAKKGSANHKRIHNTLKEIPKILSSAFWNIKITYTESEQ